MSLIPANVEYLAFGLQADKATPAATPVIAIALEDSSVDPNVQKIRTAESDQSAQQGDLIVVGAQPGGTFKKYVRPSEEDFFLAALLGKNVDAGAGPYTHTGTINDAAPFSTPYLTVWDVWPGVLTVRYEGVRIGQGVFSSQNGAAWEVEYTLVGRKATYGVAEPDVSALFVDELPHTWPEVTVTIGASAPGTINQASLTLARNTGRFGGDIGLVDYDVPNGLVDVTGNLEVAFEDDELTRAANTGTVAGTDLTTTIFEEALIIDLVRGADLETKFSLAAMQISNLRTALNTDASPAVTTFDFNSKRAAAGSLADLVTTLVKNALATADRS